MSVARRVSARINLAAIRRNCGLLLRRTEGRSELCAVVKAGGYGHGAAEAARAALAGGATRLAVVDGIEAERLRGAGLDCPIIVMGALNEDGLRRSLAAGGDVVVWSRRGLDAVIAAGGGRVHVKLDSGMGRLGTAEAEQASAVARGAAAAANVELIGLMTHFATADDRDDGGFMDSQLERFLAWALPLKSEHPELILHAANSGATLRDARTHLDMVRCGIAVYGIDPFGFDAAAEGLEPALELRSYVAEVKRITRGGSVGYGRRFIATRDTNIALVPVGYGDGWRRALGGVGTVALAGTAFPMVGTVSMDSFTVDVGEHGEELIGAQADLIGGHGPTAEEVAKWLGTIAYEVPSSLTPRVEREYHDDGVEAA
jgi:alanine racemase